MKRGKENMYNFTQCRAGAAFSTSSSAVTNSLNSNDQTHTHTQFPFKRLSVVSLWKIKKNKWRKKNPFLVLFFLLSSSIIQKQCRTHLNMFQDRQNTRKKDDIHFSSSACLREKWGGGGTERKCREIIQAASNSTCMPPPPPLPLTTHTADQLASLFDGWKTLKAKRTEQRETVII